MQNEKGCVILATFCSRFEKLYSIRINRWLVVSERYIFDRFFISNVLLLCVLCARVFLMDSRDARVRKLCPLDKAAVCDDSKNAVVYGCELRERESV